MTQQLPPLTDFHVPNRVFYWSDMLASAVLGWAAFVFAARAPLGSAPGIIATVVAVFALYRALAFTHEISHQRHRLPGFEAAWNVLVGFPLLLPAFTYAEVHFDHHRVALYGTKDDPEYQPFARSAALTIMYALHAVIIPALLVLRFLVLAPFGLLIPPLQRVLIERASAITINTDYRRKATGALIRTVRHDTLWLLAFWCGVAALVLSGIIPLRAALVWYVVMAAINVIDGLRTLAAHAYESDGAPMDKAAQTADSHDIPGGPWTELWAPVGLRYHAMHHAFPGIPYHALPAAYRRLTAAMPETYGTMTRRSLFGTLRELLRKGFRTV